jgi:hypothetical protein
MADPKDKAPNKAETSSGDKTVVVRRTTCIIEVLPLADRKQYINLDHDAATLELGRDVTITAKVEPKRAGVEVYWFIDEPTANPLNRASLSATAKAQLASAMTVTNADGIAEATLRLSLFGGDKFRVGAALAPLETPEKYSGWLEVWRKLWFEIDTMKKRGGGTLDMDYTKLPALYVSSFIELEQQGTDNQPDNKWNLETSELHTFANEYFGAEKSPFQSHEVGIDHQADKESDSEEEYELDAAVFTNGSPESYYVYGGGDTWLKSAEYKDGATWKSLDKSKVTLTGTDKVYKKIKIDLSAGPVTPSTSSKVKIKLKFIKSKEWSGDGANQPHAMVAMGYWYDTETEEEAKKRTVGTMAHELGHLLGMVPTTSPTYIDTGTGNHCTDAGCVMYSTNTETRGNNFCSNCVEELRKADLSTYKASFTHSKGSKA